MDPPRARDFISWTSCEGFFLHRLHLGLEASISATNCLLEVRYNFALFLERCRIGFERLARVISSKNSLANASMRYKQFRNDALRNHILAVFALRELSQEIALRFAVCHRQSIFYYLPPISSCFLLSITPSRIEIERYSNFFLLQVPLLTQEPIQELNLGG